MCGHLADPIPNAEDQRHRVSRNIHRCRLECRLDRPKEHLGRSTQGRVNDVARIHERSDLPDVVRRRERILRLGDDDSRGIAPATTPGLLGVTTKLRLRIDSTAARGIFQRQGCGPLKHIETRLLWLQAKHKERKLVVVKEPNQTNAAVGITKALQTSKYLEWRDRLGIGYDNGHKAGTSKREAVAEPGRWSRVEALHAVPRAVLIATLAQQTFGTGGHGWNDWNCLRRA